MYIIETIFLGLIFCLPMIWVAKLKSDLEVAHRKIEQWRSLAINLERKRQISKLIKKEVNNA